MTCVFQALPRLRALLCLALSLEIALGPVAREARAVDTRSLEDAIQRSANRPEPERVEWTHEEIGRVVDRIDRALPSYHGAFPVKLEEVIAELDRLPPSAWLHLIDRLQHGPPELQAMARRVAARFQGKKPEAPQVPPAPAPQTPAPRAPDPGLTAARLRELLLRGDRSLYTGELEFWERVRRDPEFRNRVNAVIASDPVLRSYSERGHALYRQIPRWIQQRFGDQLLPLVISPRLALLQDLERFQNARAVSNREPPPDPNLILRAQAWALTEIRRIHAIPFDWDLTKIRVEMPWAIQTYNALIERALRRPPTPEKSMGFEAWRSEELDQIARTRAAMQEAMNKAFAAQRPRAWVVVRAVVPGSTEDQWVRISAQEFAEARVIPESNRPPAASAPSQSWLSERDATHLSLSTPGNAVKIEGILAGVQGRPNGLSLSTSEKSFIQQLWPEPPPGPWGYLNSSPRQYTQMLLTEAPHEAMYLEVSTPSGPVRVRYEPPASTVLNDGSQPVGRPAGHELNAIWEQKIRTNLKEELDKYQRILADKNLDEAGVRRAIELENPGDKVSPFLEYSQIHRPAAPVDPVEGLARDLTLHEDTAPERNQQRVLRPAGNGLAYYPELRFFNPDGTINPRNRLQLWVTRARNWSSRFYRRNIGKIGAGAAAVALLWAGTQLWRHYDTEQAVELAERQGTGFGGKISGEPTPQDRLRINTRNQVTSMGRIKVFRIDGATDLSQVPTVFHLPSSEILGGRGGAGPILMPLRQTADPPKPGGFTLVTTMAQNPILIGDRSTVPLLSAPGYRIDGVDVAPDSETAAPPFQLSLDPRSWSQTPALTVSSGSLEEFTYTANYSRAEPDNPGSLLEAGSDFQLTQHTSTLAVVQKVREAGFTVLADALTLQIEGAQAQGKPISVEGLRSAFAITGEYTYVPRVSRGADSNNVFWTFRKFLGGDACFHGQCDAGNSLFATFLEECLKLEPEGSRFEVFRTTAFVREPESRVVTMAGYHAIVALRRKGETRLHYFDATPPLKSEAPIAEQPAVTAAPPKPETPFPYERLVWVPVSAAALLAARRLLRRTRAVALPPEPTAPPRAPLSAATGSATLEHEIEQVAQLEAIRSLPRRVVRELPIGRAVAVAAILAAYARGELTEEGAGARILDIYPDLLSGPLGTELLARPRLTLQDLVTQAYAVEESWHAQIQERIRSTRTAPRNAATLDPNVRGPAMRLLETLARRPVLQSNTACVRAHLSALKAPPGGLR